MPRKTRIEHADAAHHAMARGNQGQDIYADDADRKLWLETLAERLLGNLGLGPEDHRG